MHRLVLAGLACFALAVPAVADARGAHYGGIWYTTAFKASRDIEWKYSQVLAARCVAIPEHMRARYNAHSMVKNNTRMWDHFLCAIQPTQAGGGSICLSIYHATGQSRSAFNMGSYPYRGCTPYTFQ
jgi:hypothetical protein